MSERRHQWGEPVRDLRKTERMCRRCGLVKVTRHEAGVRPWIEFWRGIRVDRDHGRTPPCERRLREVAA